MAVKSAVLGVVLLASSALFAFAGLSAHAAPKRVVVLGFTGPSGAKARAGVIRGIKRKVRLVKERSYRRAARRLGVSAKSRSGVARACGAVRCHAVVSGKVKKLRRRRYQLSLTVRDGATGRVLGRRSARVRGRRRITSAARKLGRGTLRLIRRGKLGRRQPARAAAEQPDDADDEAPTRAGGAPEAEEPQLELTQPSFLQDDGGDGDDDASDASDASIGRQSEAGPEFDALALSAGIGFAMRNFEQVGGGRTTRYEGGAYPEFNLALDLYPGAWFTRSFWRNVGLGVSYSRHLSISSSEELGDVGGSGSSRSVDSGSQQLTLDAKVRWQILEHAWSPVVAGQVGWGFRDFDLDPNDVLTSFNYQFFRFGVEALAPLGTPLAALTLGVDLRPLLGIGQDAVNAYGKRDGGLAWSIRGGAAGRLPFGLTYQLTVEYLSLSADFDGRSDLTAEELLEVDRAEASSASDQFIRFWVGVGYAL